MKRSDFVKHIETKYQVQSIRYKNLALWLEIRFRFLSKYYHGNETGLTISKTTYLSVLKSLFYGFFNWFKKYDAWFLGSKMNRVLVDGKQYDRLFDYPASKIKKALFIELAVEKHFARKEVASNYIVSRAPLILLEKLVAIFINVKKIDLSVVDALNLEYGLEFSASYSVKKMIAQYKVMSLILRFTKPKIVFITPSYTAFGYIKAFKENQIKVVEVQHGVIIEAHFGYTVYADCDQSHYPDYLLTFGTEEQLVFTDPNKFLSQNQIVPVGSFYLDYIESNFQIPSYLKELKTNFKYSFAVSLQDVESGEKLISYILKAALANPKFLFILKPRRKTKSYYEEVYNLPSNVAILENLNVYELILSTDAHITVYSTCAIEAPALGRQNILVNIDNKAKEILGDILNQSVSTAFVDTESDLQFFLERFTPADPEKIKLGHEGVLSPNYQSNMDNFLKQIYE